MTIIDDEKKALLQKQAEYRAANREALRENSRRWRANHREKSRQNSKDAYHQKRDENILKKRAYNAARKDEINRKSREHRDRNISKVLERARLYRDKNREILKAKNREYGKANRPIKLAGRWRRIASQIQATPAWADHEKILTIYKLCKQITELSGIKHMVDHYYPLRGKTVCGLHVHDNLRIITATKNLKKSNKHPDDMI